MAPTPGAVVSRRQGWSRRAAATAASRPRIWIGLTAPPVARMEQTAPSLISGGADRKVG